MSGTFYCALAASRRSRNNFSQPLECKLFKSFRFYDGLRENGLKDGTFYVELLIFRICSLCLTEF